MLVYRLLVDVTTGITEVNGGRTHNSLYRVRVTDLLRSWIQLIMFCLSLVIGSEITDSSQRRTDQSEWGYRAYDTAFCFSQTVVPNRCVNWRFVCFYLQRAETSQLFLLQIAVSWWPMLNMVCVTSSTARTVSAACLATVVPRLCSDQLLANSFMVLLPRSTPSPWSRRRWPLEPRSTLKSCTTGRTVSRPVVLWLPCL
jgi:hypothetical protein